MALRHSITLTQWVHQRGETVKESVLVADISVADREQLAVRVAPFPEIDLAGYVEDDVTALYSLRSLRPDVILIGLAPHAGLGRDLIREIHKAHPTVTIILLARQMPIPVQRLWLAMGADFFLDKDTELESLVGIVLSLRSGRSHYHF